jgi:lysosomal alpha-mannosidase
VYDSIKYTDPSSISFQTSEYASEIYITYDNKTTAKSAEVVIRLEAGAPYSEWFVELGGIPDVGRGTEVTVNFYSFDIDNEDTFYTDSNGLEMQERRLNYRPTWNWTGPQNISGNYYPIQTAIAIRDTAKQL